MEDECRFSASYGLTRHNHIWLEEFMHVYVCIHWVQDEWRKEENRERFCYKNTQKYSFFDTHLLLRNKCTISNQTQIRTWNVFVYFTVTDKLLYPEVLVTPCVPSSKVTYDGDAELSAASHCLHSHGHSTFLITSLLSPYNLRVFSYLRFLVQLNRTLVHFPTWCDSFGQVWTQ